jgi:hypothetical protein
MKQISASLKALGHETDWKLVAWIDPGLEKVRGRFLNFTDT